MHIAGKINCAKGREKPLYPYNWVPIILIRIYRLLFSPLLGRWCRFIPTCSRYAEMCFFKLGFFKALILTVWRLLRCQPFGKGGYDPPPQGDG